MKAKNPGALSGRTWTSILLFGLIGQIAWVVENMYFSRFMQNEITRAPYATTLMVAFSALFATLSTLLGGAICDRTGKRKVFITWGYVIWGFTIMAFALIPMQPAPDKVKAMVILVVVMDCVMSVIGSISNDASFNTWITDMTNTANRSKVDTILAVLPLLAIAVVWLATGLWHGAAWTFILWGLFFAVFLTAEKLWYGEALAQTRFLKHLYVLLLIAVSFVIFDAASVSDAFRTIGSLFGLGGLPRSDVLARYYFDSYSGVFLVAIVGATPLPAKIVRQFSEDGPGKKIMSVVEPVVLLALLAVVTAYLVDGSFNPFLYFRF